MTLVKDKSCEGPLGLRAQEHRPGCCAESSICRESSHFSSEWRKLTLILKWGSNFGLLAIHSKAARGPREVVLASSTSFLFHTAGKCPSCILTSERGKHIPAVSLLGAWRSPGSSPKQLLWMTEMKSRRFKLRWPLPHFLHSYLLIV